MTLSGSWNPAALTLPEAGHDDRNLPVPRARTARSRLPASGRVGTVPTLPHSHLDRSCEAGPRNRATLFRVRLPSRCAGGHNRRRAWMRNGRIISSFSSHDIMYGTPVPRWRRASRVTFPSEFDGWLPKLQAFSAAAA